MTHTHGPWETKKAVNAFGHEREDWAIIYGTRIIAEAFHQTGYSIFEDAEANASLIAAAPDLLAACEMAKEMFDLTRLDANKIRIHLDPDELEFYEMVDELLAAAIAKAEGR